MDTWDDDLHKALINESRIRRIRFDLMECGNYHDVDRVVIENIFFIDEHPELWIIIKKTLIRIAHLRRELLKSWELMIN